MKVKPKKAGRVRRRMVTISIYAFAWVLLTVLAPFWLVGAAVIGVFRARSFVLLRLLIFAWFYFGFELIALLLIAGVTIRRLDVEPRMDALYRLQAWWASVNLRVAQWLLRLRIEVEGAEVALPGPSILLIRHASILDTLLPCAYVQRPHGFRVRYVLKQELLFDPCLDIVGNALPNYFVDRTGNTPAELDGVRALVDRLGTDGVLIFPEGTRFSPEKRRRALRKLEAEGSPLVEAGRALSNVLPPKPGGVLTLIDALPHADCVFFAHTGLEAFAKIEDLLSGAVVGSTVRAKLWRIDSDDIPNEEDERLGWLYAQWGKVDEFIR
ncbi:MAG: lysophospholipid acyltransferase family protein, partial [Myxococcales bacterium]